MRLVRGATLLLALPACVDDADLRTTCASTRDCPIDRVCDVGGSRQCVPESERGFTGSFLCYPHLPGESAVGSESDVVGRAELRYSLPRGPDCTLFTDSLLLIFSEGTGLVSLDLLLDLDNLSVGRPLELGPPLSSSTLDTARVRDALVDEVEAYSVSGALIPSDLPALGQPFRGWFTLDVALPTVDVVLGGDCPNGVVECGSDEDLRCLLVRDGGRLTCSRRCRADVECEDYGDFRCADDPDFGMVCLAPCTTDQECKGGRVCVQDGLGRGGCR